MFHPLVLETVAFFDLFDWPLTKAELFKLTHENLGSLSPPLEQRENFIFLRGRENLITLRKEREKRAALLWAKTRSFLSWLSLFPFVRAIFVAPRLAFHAVEEESDIDLFIIIAQNRLWFTRLLVTFWLFLLGQKRDGEQRAGKFCLNFFVTEEALDLSQVALPGDDPYLFYWSYLLVPVFDYGILPTFVQANAWLKERFPGYSQSIYPPPLTRVNFITRALQGLGEGLFYLLLGPLGERFLRLVQLKRILSKQKAPFPLEVASDTILKFHPQARSVEFQTQLPAKLVSLQDEDSKTH